MLARCKWQGSRTAANGLAKWEHGTILGFVKNTTGTKAVVAWDGHDQNTRGKLVEVDAVHIRVTTFFNWMGEGHVPGLRGVGTP